VHRLGISFDLILAIAVWMRILPATRQRAFRKLVTLLKPGGLLWLLLRFGPDEPGRPTWAAKEGEIEALATVGVAAFDRGDYAIALQSLQPVAQASDQLAQYQIGVMYLKGQGVAKNPHLGLEWLTNAAAAGAADAQSYMGTFNRRGDLVPQNYAEAMRWYLLAAKQNHENSQYRIALMYMHYRGEGVQPDLREAYMWAVIASSGGEPEPNRLRMKLEQSLSASDIVEGQRKAALWRSQNILPK
jgi:TPR repeat protein